MKRKRIGEDQIVRILKDIMNELSAIYGVEQGGLYDDWARKPLVFRDDGHPDVQRRVRYHG